MEEIIVTAQRRAENLQEIPLAITAVQSERLETVGVQTVEQVGMLVAGVNMRSTGGKVLPFIRGIGTTASGGVENPVAYYVDDVYYANQRELSAEFGNIDQIAVLKGPQGTLFGRNATGGVIQVTTRDPGSSPELELETGIDNFATWRSVGYAGGPITDGIRADISVNYTTQGEGWGYNPVLGEEIYKIDHVFGARSKWLFDLGPDTTLRVIGDYLELENNLSTNYRPDPQTGQTLPAFVTSDDLRYSWTDTPHLSAQDGGGISATLRHETDFADLQSISSYRKGDGVLTFDGDGTPVPQLGLHLAEYYEYFTQELQASSPGNSDFDWTVGAYYFWDDEGRTATLNFGGPSTPLPTSTRSTVSLGTQVAESIAGYAQATAHVLPGLNLTGGVRYTYEKRSYDRTRTVYLVNGNSSVPNLEVTNPFPDSRSVDRFTWRLAVDYEVNPDVLVYASFNTGFKSGGFNIADVTNPPYEPESVKAYETGIKTELFDRRLRFNLAAFYYDYTNIQIARFTTVTVITNGAKARLYGLDGDFEARLTDDLTLYGGFALLDSKFLEFPNAQFSEPLPGGTARIYSASAAGKDLPNAPAFTANIGVNYEVETGFGGLTFNVTNAYSSKYYFEPDNFLYQGSYNLLNSSITWQDPSERYQVQLWARNLGDETISNQKSSAAGGYRATYGYPPRQVGITLKTRF